MLATSANYKIWAGIGVATYDALIDVLVPEAELLIAKALDRRLDDAGADVTEYYDGTGTETIQLRAWPVSTITSVSYLSSVSAGTPAYTAFAAGTWYFDAGSGLLTRYVSSVGWPEDECPVWALGTRNIKVVYRAGWTENTAPADLLECIYEVVSIIKRGRDGTRAEPAAAAELRAMVLDRVGHYRRQGI